jgi:uncharacterized repeat protein (TIGR01451 family)
VRIENSPIEQGYNTDSRPVQFNEFTSANFTRSFQLGEVATVALNGTPYYEFVLDINQQNSGGAALLSLDQLRLYVSPTNLDTASNNFANGYNPATGTLGGLSPSYDMNPGLSSTNFVELNSTLPTQEAGGGTPDMTLFVPVSDLGTNPNSFIYLYSQFGGHTFTSDQGNTGGAANDGFEEWANTTVEIPTIITRAGPTVLLGSGVPLNDTATLAGGDNPTGTITFTLTGPGGAAVYTDVVTVTANGTYNTATEGNNPGGYVPTAPGTYHWLASYSGDLNNSPVASDPGDEPQLVDPAEPTVSTSAGPTVVLGGGVPLTDSATLAGGFNPGGTITFTLRDPGGTVVYTDVVRVNGNGTYDTSTGTNPGGFLPTSPGVYQWVASYSGDANNDPVASDSDDEPQVVVTPGAFITLVGPTVVVGSGAPLTDSAMLTAANTPPGGNITFELFAPNNTTTPVFTNVVTVTANGTYHSTDPGTTTGSAVPTTAGTYQWVASYSGDANGNPAATTPFGDEPQAVDPAEPTITTSAGPTVVLGSGVPLTDSATLAGGFNPGGTITFTLRDPGGTVVYTDVVRVNGNGIYDTSTGTNPGGFLPTSPGVYQWVASYSGDANNDPVASDSDDEPQVVDPAEPTITTNASPTVVLGSGVPLTDSATLAGGFRPGGTITFTLLVPGGGPVDTDVVPVSGNGTYTTPTGFVPTVPGTYQWVARYSGDPNNHRVVSELGDEPQTVTPEQADLVLVKAVNDAAPVVGQTVIFTLIVGNRGPDAATDVIVTDPLPAGLSFVAAAPSQGFYNPSTGIWAIGTLPAGGVAVLQLAALVTAAGPSVNFAVVRGDQFDPDLSNNQAAASLVAMQLSKRALLSSTIAAALDAPNQEFVGQVPDAVLSGGMGLAQVAAPASVSTTFGPAGEVVALVTSAGELVVVDAFGAHDLGGGVRAASVAFGPDGFNILVTSTSGTLILFNAFGAYTIGGGVSSASMAFGPDGLNLLVTFPNGALVQYSAAGAVMLGGGVHSAAIAFGPQGEVIDVVADDGTLIRFDVGGAHVLAYGVANAAVSFDPSGQEVLDVLFADRALWQFDAHGVHRLGLVG